MKKILFLIHDLSHGGAEKVLVNLVNNMDPGKFDITLMAIFGGGVNEQFLAPHVHLVNCFPRPFPGNSHLMKLFSPQQLHNWLIKEHYDIEVAYLEGPSARIVSGCSSTSTKKACWIHSTVHNPQETAVGFRSPKEARACYGCVDALVFVSGQVRDAFLTQCLYGGPSHILCNTNESEAIRTAAQEPVEGFSSGQINLVGVGKLVENKGFDRMIRIHKRLREDGFPTHLYILGEGALRSRLEQLAAQLKVSDTVTFLGYQTNPYKYVARCDLFLCASHAEGFSTAATEALIVGTPVCTVEVSGMKEMLGEHNEYGIVTENSEDSLYQGAKSLLENPELLAHYKHQAQLRGADFSTAETVRAVEEMLLSL